MGLRTVTLIAAPLEGMQPGRPIDWEQLPVDARAWAAEQAKNDNEMLTVLDGDCCAELGGWDVYLVQLS